MESSPRLLLYVLFSKFLGDHIVNSTKYNDSLLVYASSISSEEAETIITNTCKLTQTIKLNLNNFKISKKYYLYSLTGGTYNGEFSQQVFVNGIGPDYSTGGPKKIENIKALFSTIKKDIMIGSPSVLYSTF